MLNENDKKKLHEIARTAIEGYIRDGCVKDFEIESPDLLEKRGAFVTIKKKHMLRGCIGYVEPLKPLWESVRDMAIAAAANDPRFPEVTADELGQLSIEISALTPFRKISDINEIEVGKHGLMLRKGFRSGLLLPQVPGEYGWDRDEFLFHTFHKAGLEPGNFEGVDIYIFSAEVF